MQIANRIRNARSIDVGSAYKIVMMEAVMDTTLTDREREVIAGSNRYWTANKAEIEELMELIRQSQPTPA